MRIGIFGSAFDPPHLGHIDVIKQVIDHYDLLILVPSAAHAFAKVMSPFATRVAMLEALVAEQLPTNQSNLLISQIELDLMQPEKPVYTWDVLHAIQSEYPEAALDFIIGPDNVSNWDKFYRSAEIAEKFTVVEAKQNIPIRSILCRALPKNLAAFVGPAVANIILTTGVYSASQP